MGVKVGLEIFTTVNLYFDNRNAQLADMNL